MKDLAKIQLLWLMVLLKPLSLGCFMRLN